MSWRFQYREYVPVAQKKARAVQYARNVAKREGREVHAVSIAGKTIAKTFWGKSWCDHLESFSDFANRLPRGRTYVRNGSVVDLQISAGRLDAIVAGSDPYKVTVEIGRLKPARWKKVRDACAASIDSLLDLLGGRFSDGVMQRLTHRQDGLFPAPADIEMTCSCPDWAVMCKHVAAVLYGVGAHLDQRPELLFVLRDVDHHELVSEAVSEENLSTAFGDPSDGLAGEDLGAMFGIELDTAGASSATTGSPKKGRSRAKRAVRKKAAKAKSANRQSAKKKPAKKKAVGKKAAGKKAAKAKPKGAVRKKAAQKRSKKKSPKRKSTTKTAGRKRVTRSTA